MFPELFSNPENDIILPNGSWMVAELVSAGKAPFERNPVTLNDVPAGYVNLNISPVNETSVADNEPPPPLTVAKNLHRLLHLLNL